MTRLVIPQNITEMNADFSELRNLKEVIFENGLAKVKTSLFSKCSSLEKVVLPDTVEEIERYAFADCHNLREVVLPDKIF